MNEEAWFGLYRLLRGIGMPKVTVPVEIKKGPHSYRLPMGWPELKVAVSLDSADGKKFKQEGWQIVYIPANALNAAEPIITFLDELVRKRTVADSFAQAELTVSKTENKLLDALLSAGVSEPDRNFKFLDQHRNTITVPDFVWEIPKVAVFVDGEFFHGLRDISDALQIAIESDPVVKNEIVAQSKDTMARDAAKRRKLTKAGWKVIVVTASEIDTGELDGIVGDIASAIRQPDMSVPADQTGHADEGSVWVLVGDDGDEPIGDGAEAPDEDEGDDEHFADDDLDDLDEGIEPSRHEASSPGLPPPTQGPYDLPPPTSGQPVLTGEPGGAPRDFPPPVDFSSPSPPDGRPKDFPPPV